MAGQVTLSGALFAVGWYAFVDGVAKASLEPQEHNRASFIDWLPGLCATVGFFLVNLTHASMFCRSRGTAAATPTASATLAIGWAMLFGASTFGLSACAIRFGAPSDRQFSSLGSGVVLQTSFVALSAVCLWSAGLSPRDTSSYSARSLHRISMRMES